MFMMNIADEKNIAKKIGNLVVFVRCLLHLSLQNMKLKYTKVTQVHHLVTNPPFQINASALAWMDNIIWESHSHGGSSSS
jgi:hypothetical protein